MKALSFSANQLWRTTNTLKFHRRRYPNSRTRQTSNNRCRGVRQDKGAHSRARIASRQPAPPKNTARSH